MKVISALTAIPLAILFVTLPFGMRQRFVDRSMRLMLPLNREYWPRTLQQRWGGGDGRGGRGGSAELAELCHERLCGSRARIPRLLPFN
jgi:hypothetical protein